MLLDLFGLDSLQKQLRLVKCGLIFLQTHVGFLDRAHCQLESVNDKLVFDLLHNLGSSLVSGGVGLGQGLIDSVGDILLELQVAVDQPYKKKIKKSKILKRIVV